MDYTVVVAYAKGHLAGAGYAQAKQLDGGMPRPASPYQGAAYLAGVEWDRGFAEGFDLQERALATADMAH
jgi:hypothetical protein